MNRDLTSGIEALRRAKKAQTVFYRRLAVEAEDGGDEAMAQRLHELHADEQHHLSRLTARLVELGHVPAEFEHPAEVEVGLDGWEPIGRQREIATIEGLEAFLRAELDPTTRALVESIVEVDRHHCERLGGKWTLA